MSQLTQMELETLRHLIGEEQLAMTKYRAYSESCQDTSLKNQFQQLARTAEQDYQSLMNFLS